MGSPPVVFKCAPPTRRRTASIRGRKSDRLGRGSGLVARRGSLLAGITPNKHFRPERRRRFQCLIQKVNYLLSICCSAPSDQRARTTSICSRASHMFQAAARLARSPSESRKHSAALFGLLACVPGGGFRHSSRLARSEELSLLTTTRIFCQPD